MIKMILLPLGALIIAVLAGCASTPQEAQAAVARKFENGLTGGGRLVSPPQMGDSFGPYYQ